MNITLLKPFRDGYLIESRKENSEDNKKELIEKAKNIKNSLVYVDKNFCTVRIIYGNKR